MEMEWKKIASMEYGKIVFHSIPCSGGGIVVSQTVALQIRNIAKSASR